jgi:hypothetical protein
MSTAACSLTLENGEKSDVTLLSQVCASAKVVAKGQLDFSNLHEKVIQLEHFIFSFDQDEARATPFLKAPTPNLIGALNDAYPLPDSNQRRAQGTPERNQGQRRPCLPASQSGLNP